MKPRHWITFLVIGFLLAWAASALAQDNARKQFFADSKRAVLYSNPQAIRNCCGVGDAVKIKVIGGSKEKGLIAAMITDTMRHANAGKGKIKVGQVIAVPYDKVAKWPRVPALFKSHILFINNNGEPLCFMQRQQGG